MAKSRNPKTRRSVTESYTPRKQSRGKRYLIIGLIALALISFILMSIPRNKVVTGPQFTKEAELMIYRGSSEEVVADLDIEIADDEESIVQGLMYREHMEENQGMLFLMPGLEPRSFWMLNTYIPLDIIFVGADKRIVRIRENTVPRTTDPVTSEVPAAFVLEVNAGFAKRHFLEEGDRLAWE